MKSVIKKLKILLRENCTMQFPNALHKISIQINIVLWGYVKEVNFVQKTFSIYSEK